MNFINKIAIPLKKTYLKTPVSLEQIDAFIEAFNQMTGNIKNGESEENYKNLITNFLSKTFYSNYKVTTKGRIDLAIFNGNDENAKPAVLFETKSPQNKTEMISENKMNCKALHELILYFMREYESGNHEILKLIITNFDNWYVFKAKDFENFFVKNENFNANYQKFKNKQTTSPKTEDFYQSIIPYCNDFIASDIDVLHFKLSDIKNVIKYENSKPKERDLIAFYKFFSPENLLNKPFANDSNTLDKKFYEELLYIIGLEEVKNGGTKTIERRKIQVVGSLLESVLEKLDDDKADFDSALRLCIVWINRLLFLKLLEATQLKYQHGKTDYRFLTISFIKDFSELNELFFEVLAKHDRKDRIAEKYKFVPYLNSSLFEVSPEEESSELKICNLTNIEMKILPTSVLYNAQDFKEEKLPILDYIFRFLDAYNFASDGTNELQEKGKKLINASVLGLIFEKINGYRDGSFFTPGFITQHMADEAINSIVVQKFRERAGFTGNSIDELRNEIGDKIERKAANEVFNSIRILDPAVGSGHFLVSCLNRLVALKSYLGILYTPDGAIRIKPMDIAIKVENDELVITNEDGQLYEYNYTNEENARVQQAIFHTKKEIIENCLFGVDVNPNSVAICRLRLWIELLKNTFYHNAPNYTLQTLPNIDINIKQGNSLISRFGLDKTQSRNNSRGLNKQIATYKKDVAKYKTELLQKSALRDSIKKIKEEIYAKYREVQAVEPLRKAKVDLQDFENSLNQNALNLGGKDKKTKKQLAQEDKMRKFYQKIVEVAQKRLNDLDNDNIYSNPIEWMYDFPEVLDDEGNFLGFDLVIGNPPYISTKDVKENEKVLYEQEFGFSDDTYNLFFFLGYKLLKSNAFLTFICPKTFWTTQTKYNLRDLLLNKSSIKYIYDTANPFNAAMVDTCIIAITNQFEAHNKIRFLDGSKNLSTPFEYSVEQEVYRNTQNSVIFKPTPENMSIYEKYGQKVKELYDKWWDKIKTSRDIEKNKDELEKYRKNLKPGDVALLGCLTEGGQGLATANNGKYIAVRKSSKWAKNIIESRPKKLAEAIQKKNIKVQGLEHFSNTADFLASLSEIKIAELFDNLKEKYGRDIFGQGYIYRLINDSEMADVDKLTQDEKDNGIDTSKNFYVPYDKGDKDGNRWYLETPFAIAWSKENVRFLKTNSGKKGEGMPVVRNPQFYFREGFSWTDINSTFLKARLKTNGVFDVVSMSLFTQVYLPDWYYVCLINTTLISFYVDNFINNTSHFQINDARQLPIIIPTETQFQKFEIIFQKAVRLKKNANSDTELNELENALNKHVRELYAI